MAFHPFNICYTKDFISIFIENLSLRAHSSRWIVALPIDPLSGIHTSSTKSFLKETSTGNNMSIFIGESQFYKLTTLIQATVYQLDIEWTQKNQDPTVITKLNYAKPVFEDHVLVEFIIDS